MTRTHKRFIFIAILVTIAALNLTFQPPYIHMAIALFTGAMIGLQISAYLKARRVAKQVAKHWL